MITSPSGSTPPPRWRAVLDAVLEVSTEPMIAVDSGGRVRAANQAWAQLAGRRATELPGSSIESACAPRCGSCLRDVIQEALAAPRDASSSRRFHDEETGRAYEFVARAFSHEGTSVGVVIRARADAQPSSVAAVMESIPLPTFTWSRNGETFVLSRVNQAAQALTMNHAASFIGRRADELYADQPDLLRHFERCYADQRPLRYETDYRAKGTGLQRRCVFTFSPIPPSHIALHVEDITEMTRAQEELRTSERRLSLATRSAQLGIWDWNVTDDVLTWDARMRQLYGYDDFPADAGVDAWSSRVHPEDQERVWTATRAALRGESEYDLDFRVTWPDGTVRVLHGNGLVLRDDDGRALRMIGINYDVTERRAAEEALRQSEFHLSQAQHVARIGSWVYDVETDQPMWTSEMFRLFGRDPSLGAPDWEDHREYVHPEDWPRVDRVVREAMSTGESYELEFRVFAPDAPRDRWCRSLGRGVVDESGKIVRLHGTVQDVTVERELQERLRQADKLDALGQLAGGVAHDFNNQLAGIVGYADLLLTLLDDSTMKSYAERIVTGCHRAADLTAHLLTFARASERQADPFDTHQVIAEVANILERSVDKRIEILLELSATRTTVYGDESGIQNALLNLALNARDAMPDGGLLRFSTVDVAMDEDAPLVRSGELEPGRYLKITVRDTGVGMSPEVKRRIFEPFFTTKEVGQGTGMGMAAVFGTIRQHRGAVEVESAPGRGTAVDVLLPASSARSTAGPGAPGEPSPEDLRGLRVLIIDDESLVRDLLDETLRELGCEVRAAADGRAGVRLFQRHHNDLDLVIMDMVMPTLNGPSTFKAIREIDPEARVLVASGYSADGDVEKLMRAGACGFLQKPYRRRVLVRTLLEVMRDAGAGGRP